MHNIFRIKKISLAILVSCFALFLRFYAAYNGPFEYDEEVYYAIAVEYNLAIREGDWNQILDSTIVFEHPQFYKLIYAIGLIPGKSPPRTDSLFSHGDDLQSYASWHKPFFLRMISAFFGTATVFFLSLINPVAGLFLAINTYEIKYTSVIYLEALPTLTSLLAVMAARKSLKAYYDNAVPNKKWVRWFVLSSLSMGIAAASKYIYCIVGITIIIAVIIQGWKHKISSLIGLTAWGLLVFTFFFMLDPVLWHSPLNRLIESVKFNINYSLGMHVAEVGYPFWQPLRWLMISLPQQPEHPLASFNNAGDYFILSDSLVFILALLGLPALFKKNKLMFIWLVVGLAFLFLWNTKWPQYILVVLPPLCISAAYGFDISRLAIIKLKSRLIG